MVLGRILALFSAALVLVCALPAASDDGSATVRAFAEAQRIGAKYGFMGMDLQLEVGGSTETIELAPRSSGVIYIAAVAPDELVNTIERLKQTVIPAAPTRFLTHITPDYSVVVGLAEIPPDVTVRLTLDGTELLYSPEPMRGKMLLYAEGIVATIRSAQSACQAKNMRFGSFGDLATGPVLYLGHSFAVEGNEVVLSDLSLTVRLLSADESGYRVEARNDEFGFTLTLDETGEIKQHLDPDWP